MYLTPSNLFYIIIANIFNGNILNLMLSATSCIRILAFCSKLVPRTFTIGFIHTYHFSIRTIPVSSTWNQIGDSSYISCFPGLRIIFVFNRSGDFLRIRGFIIKIETNV